MVEGTPPLDVKCRCKAGEVFYCRGCVRRDLRRETPDLLRELERKPREESAEATRVPKGLM